MVDGTDCHTGRHINGGYSGVARSRRSEEESEDEDEAGIGGSSTNAVGAKNDLKTAGTMVMTNTMVRTDVETM